MNDPKNFPGLGWQPNYRPRAIYAQHILKTKPNAKIGILYQNDDYGKYVKGFKDDWEPGTKHDREGGVVRVADPTVDSQVVQLQSSGRIRSSA